MKHLKSFNESTKSPFNQGFNYLTDPDYIAQFMKGSIGGGSTYTIRDDGTVDVYGNVRIDHMWYGMKRIPVKFGIVTGHFTISSGTLITTLEGCPDECQDFVCTDLSIKNLIGGPRIVRGDFDAEGSLLESLEGGPEEVGGYFDISDTRVSSLVGSPKKVGGFYDCSDTNITDLIGAPEEVGTTLVANEVDLSSLEGVPKVLMHLEVNSSIKTIWDPRPLKDIKCQIIRLGHDPISTLVELFDRGKQSSIERTKDFIDSLDYNYVRGTDEKPQINLFRLKEALDEFEIRSPKGLRSDGTIPYYTFIDNDGRKVNFWGDAI